MILYRSAGEAELKKLRAVEIPPSNWAMSSAGLEYFISSYDDRQMEGGGDLIVVIEIPDPDPAEVGSYGGIGGWQEASNAEQPFGSDGSWWSFKRTYHGSFRVLDVIPRYGKTYKDTMTYSKIFHLDRRFRPEIPDEEILAANMKFARS